LLYVVGELSHDVIAFDLPTVPIENVQPIENFAANIVPPTAHPVLRSMMESGEICFHPTIPNVLYVSNRWERQVAQHEADHNDAHSDAPAGDSVTVILLARDGRSVETIKHVRSNCDVIRGMRISQDGEYAVVVGQESGGVEIYQISGDRGDIWTKTTGLSHNLGIGLKHAIWL
jgi:6-phosphogluconolactonase (cycloisomerase 2 family)